MKFAISDGKPYLVYDGMAYPCTVGDSEVKIDSTHRFESDLIGMYSAREILAKLGEGCTSIQKTETKKKVASKKKEG